MQHIFSRPLRCKVVLISSRRCRKLIFSRLSQEHDGTDSLGEKMGAEMHVLSLWLSTPYGRPKTFLWASMDIGETASSHPALNNLRTSEALYIMFLNAAPMFWCAASGMTSGMVILSWMGSRKLIFWVCEPLGDDPKYVHTLVLRIALVFKQ